MAGFATIESFNKAAIADTVHLCIDLQRSYIRREGLPIERRIGKEIAPSLSELGIPTYWVYYDMPTQQTRLSSLWRNKPKTSLDDLSHLVQQREGDLILPKHEISAMTSPQVLDALHVSGKKRLLVSGFTYAVCIKNTSTDAARMGFDVTLFQDGTDYLPDYHSINASLQAERVKFRQFRDVYAELRQAL